MIILECIAGKDQHRRVVVDQQPVKIGNAALQPGVAIMELDPTQGWITVRVDQGVLVLDATACQIPVFVNNNATQLAQLQQQDVVRIGNSTWRTRTAVAGSIKDQFTNLIGLEDLKDFKLGDIFSDVFKKHTEAEMEEQLVTGTARNTPSLAELEIGWAKPWLFARLLGVSMGLAFILYGGWDYWHNVKLVPGLIFVGSFAVPISALIFFMEMNVPRNVSLFKITQLLFIGGVASLILALIFFDRTNFLDGILGDTVAGIVEESAKVLIVIFLMGKTTRYPWILNGLLIGAAVGTGFAAFESSGFALLEMLKGMIANGITYGYIDNALLGGVDRAVKTIEVRGILAPFGHIVWTANAAAALWIVKGNQVFNWDMVKAPSFLRVFLSSVILHMLWDTNYELAKLPLVGDLKYLILGVIAWVICFRLVQTGLRQLNKARQELGGLTPA